MIVTLYLVDYLSKLKSITSTEILKFFYLVDYLSKG